MKKKSLLIGIFVVVTFSILTFPLTSAESASLPRVFIMTTHALGTKYYALASGLGKVLSSHLPSEIKVMPTTGPVEWMPMIREGEVDMGVANNWDCQYGFLAKGPFEKPMNGKGSRIRLLTSGSPNIMAVVVSETSGIKTFNDLRGKRYVGIFAGSAGQTAQAQAALANFRLTKDDLKVMSMPGVGPSIRAIIEGRADASGTAVLGMGLLAELDAGKGARFISYDPSPEAVKRFNEVFPAEPVKVEPGPGKIGVKEPITMMKYDTYLVARESLSEDAAYELVKVLWEYNSELWPIHVGLKTWTTDQFVTKHATVPYHPGAIKLFKEKGVWNSEMDKVQQKLVSMEK